MFHMEQYANKMVNLANLSSGSESVLGWLHNERFALLGV